MGRKTNPSRKDEVSWREVFHCSAILQVNSAKQWVAVMGGTGKENTDPVLRLNAAEGSIVMKYLQTIQ